VEKARVVASLVLAPWQRWLVRGGHWSPCARPKLFLVALQRLLSTAAAQDVPVVRAKYRLGMMAFVVPHTLATCSELFNATSGLTNPTHRHTGPRLKTSAAINWLQLGLVRIN